MSSSQKPYAALADIYDEVMDHVDYERWAGYVEDLIRRYQTDPGRILELGCGTGSLALRLAPNLKKPYIASDNAPAMLAVARRKLKSIPYVQIRLIDFLKLRLEIGRERFQTVLLTYDGINYAQDLTELDRLLDGVSAILEPGGMFLFDQTTPANSINNLPYFGEDYRGDGFSYSRSSSYDRKTRIHTTRFVIRRAGMVVREDHEQRAFTRMEMLKALQKTDLQVVDAFEAFGFEPCNNDTERIQWIVRKTGATAHGGEA